MRWKSWPVERSSGLLLTFSFVIPLTALVILFTSGALGVFSSGLQGSLAGKAEFETAFYWMNLLWALGWVVQLLGFGLLAYALMRREPEFFPVIPAFLLLLTAAILGIFHGTFHMSFEIWAAEQEVLIGRIPEIYEPVRAWLSAFFGFAYRMHYIGVTGMGWGLLHTRMIASWAVAAAVGWSLFWLGVSFLGAGAPGLLFIMPALIGVVLMAGKSTS